MKNLLVTLADKNYVEQAKQLFSSVYFNAGWKGDYMLLSHEILEKELKWFRDKGIMIRKCKPLFNHKIGAHEPVVLSKCYLFTEEFKKWDKIVYLDADVIVRGSLDGLTKVKGFAAVPNVSAKLSSQISNIENDLMHDFKLNQCCFCTGVFAFDAGIIKSDSFSKLTKLISKYSKVSAYGEQLVFNMFFKWKKLSPVYNVYILGGENPWNIRPEKINGIILHFITPAKPWITKNYFYTEWKYNLDRADLIDLRKPLQGKKWKKGMIVGYSAYLRIKHIIIHKLDKSIGLIGITGRKIFKTILETTK